MIRYLAHKEIDRKKWDDCVQQAFNGVVYAYSWYLDIVAENWEALVENDYERIFPLVTAKKWNIHYLYQPVFTQQLGVISKNILTEEVVSSFLNAIPSKFRFAEINLNTFNKVSAKKFSFHPWQNFELDLINAYDNIFKGYSTNLKRNIKKANDYGLTFSKNLKPDEIIDLFRKNRGKKITNLKDKDYQKLKRIAYTGIYKGQVITAGVYSPNNLLLAGAIFIRNKKKLIFLFSGLSSEGRILKAMPFLIDSVIREHAQQHLTLDFEGSNDPDLARFYKSFGAVLCHYPHLKINRLPLVIRPAVFLVKLLKKYI